MPRATLPPPHAHARPPESSGAAPHVAVRAPFTREPRLPRGTRVSRRGVALSLGAHLLMVLAVWLAPVRVREAARGAAGSAHAGAVSYVEIGAWPGGEAGGRSLPDAPAAAPGTGAVSAPPDTATAIPSFPQRAPAGIPRSGRAGRAPGGAATGGAAAGNAPASGPAGGGAGGGTAGAGRDGAGGTGRSGAAGGRLGTELGDGRLVVTPEAAPERVLTDKEKLQARIAARLQIYNDSMAADAARQRRARNWTVKDKNGREWGIAEGGAPVVAGVKIPGVSVTPPVGRSREAELYDAEVARQRGEIERQAESQAQDENLRQRTRATRERLDRERRQKREGASGNP